MGIIFETFTNTYLVLLKQKDKSKISLVLKKIEIKKLFASFFTYLSKYLYNLTAVEN